MPSIKKSSLTDTAVNGRALGEQSDNIAYEDDITPSGRDVNDVYYQANALNERIRRIDAERLAFERKDINPDLIGRESEVKEAIDINRFFADRKASKEIGIDEVTAAVDANVGQNENGVRVLKNSVTGETATLSNSAISKMFSSTSNRLDSQNIGGVLGKEAIANIGRIFDTAILIKTTPDAKHSTKNRIRRYANVICSNGENFIVKMTVKELANKRSELTVIEIEDNGGRDLSAYDMKVGRKNTAGNSLGSFAAGANATVAHNSDNNIGINDLIDFVNSYSEDGIQIDGKKRAARNSAGRRIASGVEGYAPAVTCGVVDPEISVFVAMFFFVLGILRQSVSARA